MRANWKRFCTLYDNFMSLFLATLLGVMVAIMFAQVVLRYMFNSPFTWAEEVAAYIFVWIVLLGGGPVFVRGSHIAVDYYAHFVPKKYHRKLNVLVSLPIIAFLVLLMIYGWQFVAINAGVPAYTTNLFELSHAYLAIPIGAVLMLIGLFRALIEEPKLAEPPGANQPSDANVAT